MVIVVEVELNEELFELSLVIQIPNDPKHMSPIVLERVGNLFELQSGLCIGANVRPILPYEEQKLEDELKDLVQSYL